MQTRSGGPGIRESPGYRYVEPGGVGETMVENGTDVTVGGNGLLVLVYEKINR